MKKKKTSELWRDMLEINGVMGMSPAAYLGDRVHVFPCGKLYSEDEKDDSACECKLCLEVQKEFEEEDEDDEWMLVEQ